MLTEILPENVTTAVFVVQPSLHSSAGFGARATRSAAMCGERATEDRKIWRQALCGLRHLFGADICTRKPSQAGSECIAMCTNVFKIGFRGDRVKGSLHCICPATHMKTQLVTEGAGMTAVAPGESAVMECIFTC